MLPTFFVIGAGQSGTTSLHLYLSLHPEIHMSPLKEPHFFARAEDGPWPFGRIDSLQQYEALFDSDAPVRGESSPTYSQHPLRPGVPERIKELVPEARFLYLVRDPIERVVAHYVHDVSSVGEERPLREALGHLRDPLNPFIAGSSYATQVERYRTLFPRERMLVVDQARLLADRQSTLSSIFEFLGVDPEFRSAEFERELNVGSVKRVHNPGYARLRDSALGRGWRRLVPASWREPVSRLARRAISPPVERPYLEPDLRGALFERLSPQTERLRELTGQSFETWSL